MIGPPACHSCAWCGALLASGRRRGSARRFCTTGHRQAYWAAARRWVARAIESGLISVQDLKATRTGVHASGRGI